MGKLISASALQQLLDVQAVTEISVVGVRQGFEVRVASASGQPRALGTVRGDLRRFATIDTAATFLKALGAPKFSVEMTGFEPGRLRSARPDRALALRNTRTRPHQQELL
jgi:hypothetical protein